MREIKFRAYHREAKIMRQVLSVELEPEYSTRIAYIYVWDHPCAKTAYIKSKVSKWYFKDCDLLEYTGLKDKNGKEIYEGDILVNKNVEHPALWVCTFKDGSFLFNRYAGAEITEGYGFRPDIEIIGNIYENPELLK